MVNKWFFAELASLICRNTEPRPNASAYRQASWIGRWRANRDDYRRRSKRRRRHGRRRDREDTL